MRLGTVVLALALTGCTESFLASADARKGQSPADPAPGPERNPIVFVHGWNSSGATWDTMLERFRTAGWSDEYLVAWTYNSAQSNATTAAQLSDLVDDVLARTGGTHVDVVTHSMGGLSSRYYAKNLGGDARIDAWVSLGGPNHGTATAGACFTTSCIEMRPDSRFLRQLNRRDETPGIPRYATWWSPCDVVVSPTSSTPLGGATNTRTGCLAHSALQTDAGVFDEVRAWVTGNEAAATALPL